MKTASNVPSTAAGTKPAVAAHHKSSEAATPASKHHVTGANAPTHLQTPGHSMQRPIRPTQVEPSTPDSAVKQTKPKQLPQQQAPYRPPMSQARRLASEFFI